MFEYIWDLIADLFDGNEEVVEVVAEAIQDLHINDGRVITMIVEDIIKTNPSVTEETAMQWAYKIIEEATKYKINPFLIASQAKLESTWNPLAMGKAGDTGLLQLIGSTAKEVANKLGYSNFTPDMLKNPMLNIEFSAYYLHECYERTAKYIGNDLANKDWLALASYNKGVIPAVKDYISGKLGNSVYIEYVRRYFMETYGGSDVEF